MQITASALSVLKLVFHAGSSTLSRPRLERHTGLERLALNQALDELARLGLLDARRLRLTLTGLAVAAASGARTRKRPQRAARAIESAPARRAPIALFSRREAPRAVA